MATNEIGILLNEIQKEFADSDKNLTTITVESPEIPEDTSLIQNRCDFICNDLKKLKANIEDRLILMNKNDFIINLLNYKLYEVQYNFFKRIKHLRGVKKQLESSEITPGTESKVAFKFVENEKKITECETTHEEQHRSVRQQMLEAQDAYEKSINILDDSMEIMKKNFGILLTLIEAHKQKTNGHSKLEEVLELDELKDTINNSMKLQAEGWKAAPQDITEFTVGHALKFTDDGLLITEDGKEISYNEAVELKLLDNVKLVDLFKAKVDVGPPVDRVSLQPSKESTVSSEAKMSSEDVNYLKDTLGIPLTLALAELTAVQPRDPIHYLGHWLFKYRYNEEMSETQRIEMNLLTEERDRLAREKWKKIIEEEARAAIMEMIVRAEEEAIRNELRRIEREQLEAEEEYDEELNDQFMPKDEPEPV